MGIQLRPATIDEKPQLDALIEASARDLSRGYYTDAQIEAAVRHVFGVDSELIADGTYFVAEVDGALAGCGGWSQRKNLFGGDRSVTRQSGKLDPSVDAAKIRAFFVHPAWARRGVGKAILKHCEAEARAAGFRRTELMATLPGVPFYRELGYEGTERLTYDAGGTPVEFVPMSRSLMD